MPKMDVKGVKCITPVDVVIKSNPLVMGIEKLSKKWSKRWPDIDQPWRVEGTLNPEVVTTMHVLVSTYKAEQKKGKKGKKRQEKRQRELNILHLFEQEGQKMLKADKERKDRIVEEINKNVKSTEKLMAEVNKPFSHTTPVKSPPPYEKEIRYTDVYPQLPVIKQEGVYHIKDEEEQMIETGTAKTTIKMYPSSKSKKKTGHPAARGEQKYRKIEMGEDSQSDSEEAIGGYDPAVRNILARAEKRGGKSLRKKEPVKDTSEESEDNDRDEESDSEESSYSLWSTPRTEAEERHKALRRIEKRIDKCYGNLSSATSPEKHREVREELEELQIIKNDLKKKGSEKPSTSGYSLRPRKGDKPSGKMCPVIVRGQNLEYKPLQNTDMSDILEKLPTLQEGAHPWISKLEEIMVGWQPAMGDIKRLLASILGVPAMEEILQRAGLNRYAGTAVNDPELFAACRARMWRSLKDVFPTNVHPDNIIIEPLGPQENPRAYVSKAHQIWRNITGNDPDMHQMEQSILRAKIQKGLPQPVRNKLEEVVGLGSMTKGIYTDHIAHQVELYRKKENKQREHDQEILRQLNHIHLGDSKNKKKKQAVVMQSQSQSEQAKMQLQQEHMQDRPPQLMPVAPLGSYAQPAFSQWQTWSGSGEDRNFNPNFQAFSEACHRCGQLGHYALDCY
ncbi:uncharacterized protein LOC118470224 isoform X1 [Xyrichtys novacula]|uniref:Uncharacterized protein LOC118470224 isoform X1 n=1 Tax=Xyrichtys novacula TaxID=13765 RepID=A0AAV1EXP9_XYRNO|nr:uncharacterized protein LOC118470224 isoform X1 [Xyrichtys novacula]